MNDKLHKLASRLGIPESEIQQLCEEGSRSAAQLCRRIEANKGHADDALTYKRQLIENDVRPSAECFDEHEVHDLVQDTLDVSRREHLDSCEFCKDLVEDAMNVDADTIERLAKKLAELQKGDVDECIRPQHQVMID